MLPTSYARRRSRRLSLRLVGILCRWPCRLRQRFVGLDRRPIPPVVHRAARSIYFNGFDIFKGTGSFFAGFQGGYNFMLPSRLLLGVEADASFPNYARRHHDRLGDGR